MGRERGIEGGGDRQTLRGGGGGGQTYRQNVIQTFGIS